MHNNIETIYQKLFSHYGDLKWWPANTPYEVIVGAVLTQNTNWRNVEKAISNFGNELYPETVLDMDLAKLKDRIRPAGFFNQKALYLKAVTNWYAHYAFDVSLVRQEPLAKLRNELLATKGIGPETADSILLYAFGFPTFVIDAYTIRLCNRFPLTVGNSYSAIKNSFESSLPVDANLYNHYHALIVMNAKEHCRKKPICGGCPLFGRCARLIG